MPNCKGEFSEEGQAAASLDNIDRAMDEMLRRQEIIITLLSRIADAVDPPAPEPDRTSLYEARTLTVERRRRPPLKR